MSAVELELAAFWSALVGYSLATAIAMRESSLRPDVGAGALGELGMFQVMPHGAARRVCPRRCDLAQPRCNADVALCFLSHLRETCGSDDVWVWVAAYGTGRCLDGTNARREPATRRARSLLVEAVGAAEAESIWPEG
jgi:hypothetical protein